MSWRRRDSRERWGARVRRENKNAEWTGRSTRRVASKLRPLVAPVAANPQAKGKHQNKSTGGPALPCHPDVTANTAPTLKNKVTVFDDVGYPVAVRIYRSRVWHRADALLAAGRVRGTLIVVRAIAFYVPSTIDRARLGSVSVGRAVVANLARLDDGSEQAVKLAMLHDSPSPGHAHGPGRNDYTIPTDSYSFNGCSKKPSGTRTTLKIHIISRAYRAHRDNPNFNCIAPQARKWVFAVCVASC
jgi:hypothetical protein